MRIALLVMQIVVIRILIVVVSRRGGGLANSVERRQFLQVLVPAVVLWIAVLVASAAWEDRSGAIGVVAFVVYVVYFLGVARWRKS